MGALALDPGLAASALGWRGRIGAAEAVRLTAGWYGAWRRGGEMERFTRDQIRAYAGAAR
jgi:CDP-glucose 4,6-dehydratase